MGRPWEVIVDGSFIIISVSLWSINEVLIKKTAIQLSGVLFISNLVSALCCLLYWYSCKPMKPININLLGSNTKDKCTLFLFFLVQSGVFTFYYALIRLPLGDLACIGYQAPLWIILLSRFLFNDEKFSWFMFIPAALLVITGVMFVSQPSFIFQIAGVSASSLPLDGVLASFISAARWVAMVLIIKMGGDSLHTVQYQFMANIACLFISVPLLLVLNSLIFHNDQLGEFADFLKMSCINWLVAVYVGFTYFIGMLFDMKAYQRGNVALIGWLEYLAIPLAFIYQIFIFHDNPDLIESVGASMVMVGCLLPGLHEMIISGFGKGKRQKRKSYDYSDSYRKVSESGDSIQVRGSFDGQTIIESDCTDIMRGRSFLDHSDLSSDAGVQCRVGK